MYRFVALLFGLVISTAAHADNLVGHVVMSVGKSYSLQDNAIELARGDAVYTGNTISVSDNSVLQVRTIDGGYLVIRSNSRVKIDEYYYLADQPEETRVVITALSGQAQWISGKGVTANRSGFRLNTPLAAIGVRGTDFIADVAENGVTKVQLLSGAIVVSPLNESCLAQRYGACMGELSRLVDEPGAFIIEVDSLNSAPKQKAIPRQYVQKTSGTELITGLLQDNQQNIRLVKHQDLPTYIPEDSVLTIGKLSAESHSAPFATAEMLASKGYSPVFVNQGLLLSSKESFGYYPSGLLTMNLMAGIAQSAESSQSTNASFSFKDGLLMLNLDSRRFDTQLTLLNGQAQTQQLNSQGRLTSSGFMFGETGNMSLKGVVSPNLQDAAYLFTGPAGINGFTYWQVR